LKRFAIRARANRAAAFLALFLLVFEAEHARACSCDYPDLGFLAAPSIEVPANAQGLLWAGVLRTAGGLIELPPVNQFRVEQFAAGEWVSVGAKINLFRDHRGSSDSFYDILLVGPETGFRPGTRFRFEYAAREGRSLLRMGTTEYMSSQTIEVLVSEEEFRGSHITHVAAERERGTLRVAATGCHEEVEASWVTVDELVPASVMRWQDSLFFSVMVGDRYWHPRRDLCQSLPPGRSWAGLGQCRFYWIEEEVRYSGIQLGLDGGDSGAVVYAWLPGTSEWVTTTNHLDLERIREQRSK